jgi:hypothetical protein
MVKANTQVTPTNQVTTGAVLKGPLLTSTGAFNYAAVQTFINTKAGGNANNVAIVPCKGVTFASFTMGKGGKAPCKTLGGFNAQQYGVRQTMLWHALNGQLTLGAWLNACKSKGALGIPSGGQSATKPIVLLALLNGGFSRNANTWGVPQVQLVVKPQTVKA